MIDREPGDLISSPVRVSTETETVSRSFQRNSRLISKPLNEFGRTALAMPDLNSLFCLRLSLKASGERGLMKILGSAESGQKGDGSLSSDARRG